MIDGLQEKSDDASMLAAILAIEFGHLVHPDLWRPAVTPVPKWKLELRWRRYLRRQNAKKVAP